MSFWKTMNLLAWGLSIYLFMLMFLDFFKVEKKRREERKGPADRHE